MNSLFGTSGIRGSAKEFLTNQFCFDIGRAFAKFLAKYGQKGEVTVGIDPRKSGPRIKKAFLMGLQKEGYKVSDQGIVPAPAMNYILITNPSLAGSAIITGSHIRSDFNGIKFFAFKEEILKKQEREIEKIYKKIKERVKFKTEKVNPVRKDGGIGLSNGVKFKKSNEAANSYKKMLLNLAKPPYPKWKVVIDLGNGCQSKLIPEVFKKLGIKTLKINTTPKPDKFIARDTETEEVIKELQKKVKKERADFGLAFDADGDRVVFVDKKGKFIPGDYAGALIAKYSPGPIIITPVNASQVVESIGKKIVRTKVGSPYVVEAMKKHKATFGFESNGGGISAEIMMTRDAGSVSIKILNLLKQKRKSLEKLTNTLPKFFVYRTKIDCPQELNSIILKKTREKFKNFKMEKIDGLKIWIDSFSWILFRPSSNAPEFRVFTEAKTKEKAESLAQEGVIFVKSLVARAIARGEEKMRISSPK